MSNTAGLSITEDGSDFILSVADDEGAVTTLKLAEDQMMTLCQSAPLYRDRISLRRSPAGGDISAVIVTPVSHLGVQPDSLKETVLLTLQSETRGRLTFSLDPGGVQLLLEHLPGCLDELKDQPTRQ